MLILNAPAKNWLHSEDYQLADKLAVTCFRMYASKSNLAADSTVFDDPTLPLVPGNPEYFLRPGMLLNTRCVLLVVVIMIILLIEHV